ncbi:MAG: prepilin-type N-terminal cleavage/methylation domain-containing protein [Fibrobacterota bacterium]
MNRRGYTLVEVLMALVILAVLAVPLVYILNNTGTGSSRARDLDEALALAREDWTLCRATNPDSLRDTVWERPLASGEWRIERDVFDSSDRFAAGLSPIRKKAAGLTPPIEISSCALRAHAGNWDTIRCFQWMRPRWSAAR